MSEYRRPVNVERIMTARSRASCFRGGRGVRDEAAVKASNGTARPTFHRHGRHRRLSTHANNS